DDLPSPINIYGETKQLAEQAARKVPDHLIVRTQWLIGPGRNNFVSAVVQAAREGRELRVIADQWGCPTYTRHLAAVLWELALADFRGVVHAAGDGVATWWDVAEAALAAAGLNVLPEKIALEDWPAAARRPRYCVLDCSRLSEWLGRSLPPWRQGVGEYVRDFL
ncbi:MAG: NAD(P)-dependent oxidoreductase, partial [Armatimonadetes bacterium]|nr:NAD(P)-dependent oxidoreductase [Armatimonadota bacterium]